MPRAHRRQRLDHALHRAGVQVAIADEARGERPRREQAREEAHRRARVAAVEIAGGGGAGRRGRARRPRRRRGATSRMATPRARSTPMVERLSSPPERPRTVARPSAMAAKSTARWPIDLSPGTLTSPSSARAGPRTVRLSRRARRFRRRRSRLRRLAPAQPLHLLEPRHQLGRRAAPASDRPRALRSPWRHHERLDVRRQAEQAHRRPAP